VKLGLPGCREALFAQVEPHEFAGLEYHLVAPAVVLHGILCGTALELLTCAGVQALDLLGSMHSVEMLAILQGPGHHVQGRKWIAPIDYLKRRQLVC
jgi:hypothetical protein